MHPSFLNNGILRAGLILLLLALALPWSSPLVAQPRSMERDSTLDNLRHPAGTDTTPYGTLGLVRKVTGGPGKLLLIPGIGFGAGIWNDFIERHKADHTIFAVTLPGFGDTPPLAIPEGGSPYAANLWTNSSIKAIGELLDREAPEGAVIVAHWALATQIALRLALDKPDRVKGVILIGGPLKAYYENTPGMLEWNAEQRSRFAEGMARGWFKTVTRKTWDDNNYMSYDYSINPRRGLFLWREAQRPSLPVWIRYLLEWYAVDLSSELKNLKVPVLVVQPGFADADFYVEPGLNYMRNLCLDTWKGAATLSDRLRFVTVPGSRLFVMDDKPEETDRIVREFLSTIK